MYSDDPYFYEVGGGASRLLNALTDGDSVITYSAWSWFLARYTPSKWGALRVKVIEAFAGAGHCKDAHEWHMARNLYSPKAMAMIAAQPVSG